MFNFIYTHTLKPLIKRLIKYLLNTKWYSTLMFKVIPFIRFSTYYTDFKGTWYHEMYDQLMPGDIILTNDNRKLTSMLIPGTWSHAALCVSKDKKFEVAEMTHVNYNKVTFFDICSESDRVCILRCKDWDVNYIVDIIDRCKSFENAKYDIRFELGIKTLYCSELVYQSDFKRLLDIKLDDIELVGEKYISPDGLYHAKNIEIISDSSKLTV